MAKKTTGDWRSILPKKTPTAETATATPTAAPEPVHRRGRGKLWRSLYAFHVPSGRGCINWPWQKGSVYSTFHFSACPIFLKRKDCQI